MPYIIIGSENWHVAVAGQLGTVAIVHLCLQRIQCEA